MRVDRPQELRRVGAETHAAAPFDLAAQQRERAEPGRGADDEGLDEDVVAVGVLADVDRDAVLGVPGAEADGVPRGGGRRRVVCIVVVCAAATVAAVAAAAAAAALSRGVALVVAAAPAAAPSERARRVAAPRRSRSLGGRAGHRHPGRSGPRPSRRGQRLLQLPLELVRRVEARRRHQEQVVVVVVRAGVAGSVVVSRRVAPHHAAVGGIRGGVPVVVAPAKPAPSAAGAAAAAACRAARGRGAASASSSSSGSKVELPAQAPTPQVASPSAPTTAAAAGSSGSRGFGAMITRDLGRLRGGQVMRRRPPRRRVQPLERPLERRVPLLRVLLPVERQRGLGVVKHAVEREAEKLLLFVRTRKKGPQGMVLFGPKDGEPAGLDAGEAAARREGPDAAEACLAGLGLGAGAEAIAVFFCVCVRRGWTRLENKKRAQRACSSMRLFFFSLLLLLLLFHHHRSSILTHTALRIAS